MGDPVNTPAGLNTLSTTAVETMGQGKSTASSATSAAAATPGVQKDYGEEAMRSMPIHHPCYSLAQTMAAHFGVRYNRERWCGLNGNQWSQHHFTDIATCLKGSGYTVDRSSGLYSMHPDTQPVNDPFDFEDSDGDDNPLLSSSKKASTAPAPVPDSRHWKAIEPYFRPTNKAAFIVGRFLANNCGISFTQAELLSKLGPKADFSHNYAKVQKWIEKSEYELVVTKPDGHKHVYMIKEKERLNSKHWYAIEPYLDGTTDQVKRMVCELANNIGKAFTQEEIKHKQGIPTSVNSSIDFSEHCDKVEKKLQRSRYTLITDKKVTPNKYMIKERVQESNKRPAPLYEDLTQNDASASSQPAKKVTISWSAPGQNRISKPVPKETLIVHPSNLSQRVYSPEPAAPLVSPHKNDAPARAPASMPLSSAQNGVVIQKPARAPPVAAPPASNQNDVVTQSSAPVPVPVPDPAPAPAPPPPAPAPVPAPAPPPAPLPLEKWDAGMVINKIYESLPHLRCRQQLFTALTHTQVSGYQLLWKSVRDSESLGVLLGLDLVYPKKSAEFEVVSDLLYDLLQKWKSHPM